jgi:hypothetical protein
MYARSNSGLSELLEPDSNQYWLVHRTHVDVPSMYRPRGRYRYTHGIVSPCNVDTFYTSENATVAELARCRCYDGLRAT